MTNNKSSLMKLAALMIFISGILHLLAIMTPVAGMGPVELVVVAALYTLFAWALSDTRRWLMWVCYLIMMMGSVIAYVNAPGSIWWALIAVADVIAALTLFVLLWRSPEPAMA